MSKPTINCFRKGDYLSSYKYTSWNIYCFIGKGGLWLKKDNEIVLGKVEEQY